MEINQLFTSTRNFFFTPSNDKDKQHTIFLNSKDSSKTITEVQYNNLYIQYTALGLEADRIRGSLESKYKISKRNQNVASEKEILLEAQEKFLKKFGYDSSEKYMFENSNKDSKM